uniref:Helicase C-terminal domain-containing protein n=1 Tax=Trichogramma kaykai TaxID=54128 RepID=A0ABD2X6K2_9HYME
MPFLLRRTKEDVLTDLPPKITQDYFCDLSPLQKTLYEDFQVKNTILVNKIDINAAKSSGHIFKALRYLKNVCNHPKLVLTSEHPEYSKIQNQLKNVNSDLSDIEHAAKLPALKQLLLDCGIGQSQQTKDYQNYYNLTDETLSESNFLFDIVKKNHLVGQHRALIFCQLKNMLDIIEKDLFQKHLPTVTYMRIDGNVSIAERQSIVSRFNADPSIDILLLTTHVGGLGLNLTGADTVIFFEHDWNPMKDLQAMDRAHRIGQKKVVNVYRLITKQTIEEKIMNLQKFKLHTAKSVVNIENKSLKSMHKEEILDLFKLDNSRKKKQNTCSEDNIDNKNVNLGTSKSVSEFLSTISEGYEYEEEYDINSYIVNFKSFLGKDDE